MGISPFKTRFELLLEKAELKEDTFEGNIYTEYGNILEPQIRDFINKSQVDKYVEGKHIQGDIRCHTDGINKTSVLEIKTTSKIYSKLEDYKLYLVQLLFYMQYTKREKGKLAIYFREDNWDESMHIKEHNFDYEFKEKNLIIYDIDIKDYAELIKKINLAVKQFKIDLAKIKENPFLTEEQLMPVDIVKATKKVVAMEKKLAKYKEIEDEYGKAKEQLKKLMMETGNKKWETPNGIKITLVEDTPDKEVDEEYYNEEKFKEENSNLYEDYHNKLEEYKETKKVTKKGKKGYVKITLPKE